MKTLDNIQKFNSKEVLAWFVLTCALVLLGVTLSFAQDDSKKNVEGKIHIKIEKEENGNKIKVDTTFDVEDFDKVQDYIHSLDATIDLPAVPGTPVPPGDLEDDNVFRFHAFSLDEKDQERFNEEMKKLKIDMKDLQKSLMKIRMEMFHDSSGRVFPHGWMDMGDADSFADAWIEEDGSAKKRSRSCVRVYSDSVSGKEKVIIIGDAGDDESSSMIEKSYESSDGEKVIVIKRSSKIPGDPNKPGAVKKEKSKTSSEMLSPLRLEYYPNPGNGKFTLNFKLEKKGDTSVRIVDPSGKEIYSETLKDFNGEYSKQIDISQKGKGTYLLKISQNGKSISKKVVVD